MSAHSQHMHVARGRSRRLRRLAWWIPAVLMMVVCFFWIYPFLWTISASLKSPAEVFSNTLNLFPEHIQWDNYARAWTSAHFGTYLQNTIIVTISTVAITVVRSAMAGYVLARYSFRGRRLAMGVIVVTLFAPTGYTIIPLVSLSQSLGLLNSLSGMILALSGTANVAAILLYFGYFRQIPRELSDAAEVDGAGFWRMFWDVMLPNAKPITATVVILTFLSTWNAFFLPLVFSFSRPELRTLGVGMLAFVGDDATDWTGLCAAAVISLAPIVIVFTVLQRNFVEGMAGAVKL